MFHANREKRVPLDPPIRSGLNDFLYIGTTRATNKCGAAIVVWVVHGHNFRRVRPMPASPTEQTYERRGVYGDSALVFPVTRRICPRRLRRHRRSRSSWLCEHLEAVDVSAVAHDADFVREEGLHGSIVALIRHKTQRGTSLLEVPRLCFTSLSALPARNQLLSFTSVVRLSLAGSAP